MNKQPTLDFIQQAVGGSIEMVPHFIKYEGQPVTVVYANEDARRNEFEIQPARNAGVVVVSPWRAETLSAPTLWRYTHRCANAQRLTQSYTTTICRSSDNAQLLAIERFAPGPATGFDRRWAPSHGKQFTARRFGLPQNRQRRHARPPTVWPARLGTSACSAFRGQRSHRRRCATRSTPGSAILGHQRTCLLRNPTSALPPKSDPSRTSREVRKVPHFRTCVLQHPANLFESPRRRRRGERRDSEAEDLRRFKIDDQLKINRLHDRPAFGRASCLKSKPGIFFILRCR